MDMTPEAGGNTGALNPEMFKARGKRTVDNPASGKPPIDTRSEQLERRSIHGLNGDLTVEFPIPITSEALSPISSELAAMEKRAREEAYPGWLDDAYPDVQTANPQISTAETTPRNGIKNKIADTLADLFKPAQRRLVPASVAVAGFLAACSSVGGAQATPEQTNPGATISPSPITTELPSQSAGSPSPTPTTEVTPSPTPTETPKPKEILSSPTLRDLADKAKVKIASQIVYYKLNDPTYAEAAREICNELMIAGEVNSSAIFSRVDWSQVLDNWNSVKSQLDQGKIPFEDQLRWNPGADQLIAFAKANNMPVIAGSLLWGGDIPTSVLNGKFSSDQLNKVLEFMIKSTVIKYKEGVDEWYVASEVAASMLYGDNKFKFWFDKLGGRQVVYNAFEWTHEADPKAKLMIYEDHILDANNAASVSIKNEFFDLLRDLKKRNIPIDDVGIENNFWVYAPPNKKDMIDTLKSIQAMGYSIGPAQTTVAESKVYPWWNGRPKTVSSISNLDAAQASIFKDVFDAYLQTGSEFGMFGFTDAVSAFDATNLNIPDAKGLILDSNYKPKPAYKAMVADIKAYIASKAKS